MATQITELPTPPNRGMTQQEFSNAGDNFLGALPDFGDEINAVANEVEANATLASDKADIATSQANAATAAVNVSAWVSGTTYAIGDARYSPANLRTYRRITNGAGTTDPSLDATNWLSVTASVISTQTKTTAYNLVASDLGSNVSCTGTFTLGVTSAATLGNGWYCYAQNNGTGIITIDPSGSQTIGPSLATYSLQPGGSALISSDGANIKLFCFAPNGFQAVGSSVASASTINLDTVIGDILHVTGTTTVTVITLAAGVRKTVIFDSSLTIANSANLILPYNNNIITSPGMVLQFVGDTGGVVRYCGGTVNVPTLVLREQQAVGVASTTASLSGTSGQVLSRNIVLNTVLTNTITGSSLSSNNAVLPAGTYEFDFVSPVRGQSAGVVPYLYNNTSNSVLFSGQNMGIIDTTPTTMAMGKGSFTLSTTSSVALIIAAKFSGTQTIVFGDQASIGGVTGGSIAEQYSQFNIRKVA